MAKKYWWEEDEKQTTGQSTNKTSSNSSSKTEKKYWWEDDTQQSDTTTTKGRWWDDGNIANVVGKDIANKVNSWLQNHNSYISDYQSRYSGRKYSYEDAYVSDSADWLTNATERKSSFDTEAEGILSYLDQYKGYLDSKWVDEIKKTITDSQKNQGLILDAYTKDNEYWNSFNNEELVNQYGSAEGAYNYYQRADGYSKKYTGMTSTELDEFLNSMEDGEEKDWLNSYKGTVYHDEMLKYDTTTAEKELASLEKIMESYGGAARYYDMYQANPEALAGNENGQQLVALYNEYQQKFGSQEDLEKRIHDTRLNINNAKRIQRAAELESVFDSASENYDPEFGKYSGYVDDGKTALIPDYKDLVYDAVNGKVDDGNLAVGQSWGDGFLGLFDVGIQGGEKERLDSIKHMTEDEKALYNYYYNKHGYDAAEEYLDGIMDRLNYRHGEAMFKPMENKWVLEEVFGIAAGLDQFNSGLRSLFSDKDYIPTSAIQNASGMVREDLKDVGVKLPDWMGGASLGQGAYDLITTTSNMAPSILASTVVGAFNPAAGAAVGNVLMGASAAGNAYQEALNLGYDKGQARAYSTLVGASEVGLQYLLGGLGKLGGKLSGKAATSLASKFDNAYARLAVKYGMNMLSEGGEEYLQEVLTPVFKNLALGTDEEFELITEEAIYSFLLGAISSGFMEGTGISSETGKGLIGNLIDMSSKNEANINAANMYGDAEVQKALIKEGLASDVDSESYQLAEMFKRKTDKGKSMTGYEIRQQVEANEARFAAENYNEVLSKAENRLTELGESKNVDKIAKLVAKRASGQELTRSEISTLVRSQYGSQVAKEMTTSKEQEKATYKPLEERVGTESTYSVSKSGQATIQESGEAFDIAKAEVTNFVTDKKTGKITDVTFQVDGKEVKASGIDYADDSQSYLVEAVSKIENITPAAATAIIHDYNPSSGQTVGEYLNGIDEGYNYGYYGYSVADLKAGNFAPKLSSEQMMSAYRLGQSARSIGIESQEATRKKMRTAAEAKVTAEQRAAQQKARIESKDTEVYFEDGKSVVKFDEHTGKYDPKRMAAVNTAKFLSKLGIGGKYYFFESYVNADGVRVYKDANGNEVDAPNGVYKDADGSIHIDLNAGDYGQGTALFTLGHELTHFVKAQSEKQFKILGDLVKEAFDKTDMSMHERVLAKQKFLEDKRGKAVSYAEAYEEVVADAMSTMLSDGSFYEKIMEIKVKDKGLFNTIKRFFEKMIAKFKKEYEALTPDQRDAQDIRAMKDAFDKIQQAFAEALVEASDNFQVAMESVVETSAEAMSADEIVTEGAVVTNGEGERFSIRSMKHDIAEGKMFEDLKNICGWTNAQVNTLKTQLNDLVEYMIPYRNILDMNESYGMEGRRFSPYKPNSDPLYKISMDFSTLCSKRLLTQYVIEQLQLRENRPMSAEEQMAIRDMLNEYRKVEKGLQVACAMCYVEAARLKSPKQIQRWLDDPTPHLINYFALKNTEFNASVKKAQADFKESRGYDRNAPKKDMKQADVKELNKIGPKMRSKYQPSAAEQAIIEKAKTLPNSTYLTAGNLAGLSETDPAIYDAYTSFVRTATRSKSLETDEPYYYGDSTRDNGNGIVVTDSFIEAVNRENGMRFSSWSDWRIQHLLDYITAVIDNSVRGAAMHGYTKFGDEVRVLGKTGMMFNMSGVTGAQTGLNEDGSLNFSETESIDVNEAIQLREEFPEHAGLQCIGVSNEHIIALLRSDIIDYVIPYHVSGLNADLRRMAKIYGWKDYTGTQHAAEDKSIKYENAVDKEHWHQEPVFSEFFVGYDTGMSGIDAMRESAERYKQMCKDRGLTPKFNQFANEANYWKLLIDRKMINQQTGNLIRQKAVTPTFDFDTIKGVVDKFVENYDAGLEGRALNHIVENWDTLPQRIKDLKKKGNTKAKKTAKAVDTLSNQTLAAQPAKNSDRQNKNRASNGSPLTRRSVKQRSVGSTHGKMSSTAAAEKLGIENIAKYSDSVKEAIAVLGEFYVSVDTGKPVLGFGKTITASNLEGSLIAQNVLTREGTGGSAYRYDNGHALRISNHSANANNFVGDGEHLSMALFEKGKMNDFVEGKSNVIEAVFRRKYLDGNPEALKQVIHDIAHFIAEGEYHDTAGAMRYNFSGTEAFKKQAQQRMADDKSARVKKFSERSAVIASDFASYMANIVKTNRGWYAKDVFKYVEEHPELGFIELIYAKDKDAKKFLEKFLGGIDDVKVLDQLSWYMGEAYGDKDRTWNPYDGATYPYRGAVRTFRNAIKKRINAIMTERVGGTNLGIKNGEVTLGEVKEMFARLNSNEEIGQFAEKVFATAEKLGVNIRFVNQTLAKSQVAGDNLGDMVEYKTSYFNDTTVTDQRKASTILHELIHACTVYVLDANKTMGDVSWNKSENYNKISNAATRLNRIYFEISYDTDFQGQYGIKNAKEMVAELANEEFVGLMKKKNLWDSIVDWICDLFGIRRGTSAYDNARLCVDYILDNPEVSEYKAHAAEQRRSASRNGYEVFGQTRYSERNNAPTFYSQMGKVVEGMKQEKFGASSVISMLRGRGVKAEEIRWSGIQAFLDGKKSVTKQELLDFINGSMLHIEETILDGRPAAQAKLPDNYRLEETTDDSGDPLLNLYIDNELVDTFEQIFDGSISSTGDSEIWAMNEADLVGQILNHYAGMSYDEAYLTEANGPKWGDYKLDGGENYRELVFKMPGSIYTNNAMRGHWGNDAQGVLAHARIQDFNTFIGKMLFIEEIQSDWHNEGHRNGYGEPLTEAEQNRIMDDVLKKFVASDVGKAIVNKTMKHYGLESEAEAYAWIADEPANVGAELIAHYPNWMNEERIEAVINLQNQFDNLSRKKAPDAPFKENYQEFVLKRLLRMAAEEGYDSIGWTTADIQSNRWNEAYAEGYRIEYDQDIPKFLKKYGKQWGTTVGKTTLDNGTEVWSMAITDSMQKSVLEEGQAMYSERGEGTSNRHLLANAFEGITQNSVEYKMLQDYKGMISTLNRLDKDLSDINAEIRKIRFGTEGARDMETLRKLEEKAGRIAKDINRYDKRLLSLEASEPLRKVIEQERKKEAQKTKDHVKEIQQNKKLRAEQTELRHKIRKAVRDLDKILNRGDKQRNVKEDMKGFASKALELADYLFTDHISNDMLILKGIDPDLMRGNEAQLVKETEDILTQLYYNSSSLTSEEAASLDAKRKRNMDKLRDVLTQQRNRRLNTPVYNLFNDLVTEYASLQNSNQDAVKAAYDPNVERFLRSYMGEENGTTDSDRKTLLQNMRVADMTTKELEHLYYAYKMVLHSIREANKLHIKGKTETVEQMAGRIMGDFSKRNVPDGKAATVIRNLSNKLGWDYEKLYYALDRIGSEAFAELVMNIANSENIVMQDIMEAVAFRDEMVKNYDFNNWAVNKEIDREFLDNTGKKFKVTLGQLMALYAYSRREGAWDHIEYGGFVFGEAALTNPKPADSYKLTKDQCEAITGLLTKEQKRYVEDMQKFLSETMGEKGNEVSMLLYGIKMFNEKNYFPIHIAGQFKAQANESQAKAAAGFSSMSNAGFTHAQNPNAKAPFVLEGFNEIWADHVNEMSRYHGTVPALEDMRKVMNRSFYSESGAESMAIKQMMENSYGKEAVEYFDNLYREANSGAITDKLQKKSKKLLSLFRKNSVAYSLSVLVQQPASLVRAYAMVDKKYFGIKGFGTISSGIVKAVSDKWTKAHTNAYNEMLKYAPGVTLAKEIGGFDTATGGSIRSYLLDTNKKFVQSMKTENLLGKGKAVMDLVDDNAIANLPNVADKIAWIEIWNACKRETVATHKDLTPNSEEFMQAVGERFTEVIRATQVYDSIFAKSPMLKSKNLAVQYLVSFMNEPNTIANMAESAVRDATKGNWKGGAAKAVALAHSIIFTNVLKSIVYAMRDDDEDETYIEKYLEAVTENMMSDVNPFNYIPIARDVVSLAQGYDVERADMAIVADALDALNGVIKNATKDTGDMTEDELIEFDKKVTEANWKLVESIASFFGIPVKNIRREIEGVLDHARIAYSNAGKTTRNSAWDKVYDAVIGSIPFIQDKPTKQGKLYDAIMAGDEAYLGRLKSTYKTDDAYISAVRKALRENDPRIQDAAQARYDGNTEEYKRIFREIQKEGKFGFDDIMSAINSEESAIRNKVEPDKVTSSYTASGFVEAVAMDDTKTAQAMKDDIIASKVANGKTQEEAEKEFMSDVAAGIGKAYSSGLLDEAGAEKMLMEYAGKDEEEAASKVSYWVFCEEHPEYKDVLSESNVAKYHEFAEPAEIPVDVYAQFVTGTKGLADIKDEWGDVEVSKRDQVLEVIDSLPLTWQQKDALYLAADYAESKIWDVPW